MSEEAIFLIIHLLRERLLLSQGHCRTSKLIKALESIVFALVLVSSQLILMLFFTYHSRHVYMYVNLLTRIN